MCFHPRPPRREHVFVINLELKLPVKEDDYHYDDYDQYYLIPYKKQLELISYI